MKRYSLFIFIGLFMSACGGHLRKEVAGLNQKVANLEKSLGECSETKDSLMLLFKEHNRIIEEAQKRFK